MLPAVRLNGQLLWPHSNEEKKFSRNSKAHEAVAQWNLKATHLTCQGFFMPHHAWQLPGHCASGATTANFPTEVRFYPGRQNNTATMAQPCDKNIRSGEREHLISSPSLTLQRWRGMWIWIRDAPIILATVLCCQGHHNGKRSWTSRNWVSHWRHAGP